MNNNSNCAGKCIIDDVRLEYQVVYLEYITGKSINIEFVSYNPFGTFDKERTFKHTERLSSKHNLDLAKSQFSEPKLRIASLIVESLITNLELPKDKLRKLIVRRGEVFYVCAV